MNQLKTFKPHQKCRNPHLVHFGSIVDPAADYPANCGQCALKPHEDCNIEQALPQVKD